MSALSNLIRFYENPVETAIYYHGDIINDTLDALRRLNDEDENDVRAEVMSQLPEEDELCDIIDNLTEALDMNKDDMIAQIRRVLVMLGGKQSELNSRAEYARELLS
ncbi:MAG: hypothetical protein ACRCYD_07385 [Plesiomonas sp.]